MRDRKDLLQYNAEGYYDPTAGKALLNALRNRPIGFVRWMGQPIYICPGNDPKMISDTRLLRQFCRRCSFIRGYSTFQTSIRPGYC